MFKNGFLIYINSDLTILFNFVFNNNIWHNKAFVKF